MLKSIKKFLRLKILITCYAIAYIGAAATHGITAKTVLILFVLAAWYVHAASSNDYADRFIDAVNLKDAKDRPLLTGDITGKQLWGIHIFSGLASIFLAAFYGYWAIVIMLIVLVFDYLYSFKPIRISDRGILSQLILPIAYVCLPFTLGYLSVEPHRQFPILLGAALYTGFTARLFLKDFRDVKGDKLYGKNTYLLRHGVKVTCITSGVFSFISFIVMLYATHYSAGIACVLVLSQVFGLLTLYSLAYAKTIKNQLVHIAHVARLANAAVLSILAYFLCLNQSGLLKYEVWLIPVVIGVPLLGWHQFNYYKGVKDLK